MSTQDRLQGRLADAVESLDVKAVRQALADGADATLPVQQGRLMPQPVLHWAVWQMYGTAVDGNALNQVVDDLCAAGADVHARDGEGNTLWHLWARSPVTLHDLASRLQGAGVSVNAFNDQGYSPAAVALSGGNFQRTQQLIQYGATPMGTDEFPHLTFAQFMIALTGMTGHSLKASQADLDAWMTWYLDQPPESLWRVDGDRRTLGQYAWNAPPFVLQRLHEAEVDWDAQAVQVGNAVVFESEGVGADGKTPLVTVRSYICGMARHYRLHETVGFFEALKNQEHLQATLSDSTHGDRPRRRI